jgi:hypothetical protein
MDNELKNSFDASIRKALQDHQVPYDDSTWDMLEGKLKAAEQTDDATLDQVARKALSDYQVPYDHSTWTILSKRLDRIDYRNRLILAKFFEAAVIFFAVFTMVQFLGNIPDIKDHLPMPFSKAEKLSEDRSLDVDGAKETYDLATSSVSKNRVEGKIAAEDANATHDQAEEKGALIQKLSPAKNLADAAHRDIYRSKTIAAMRTLGHLSEIERKPRSYKTVASVLEPRKTFLPTVVRRIETQHTIPSVPLLPEYDLAMVTAETANDFRIVAVERVPKVVTKLNLFYQYNVHRIENVAQRQNSYNQTEYSNGIGFAANVQFGNVGFDLGAIYDEIQYNAGFERNEIQKIQIPLNLRYNGFRNKYADIYLKGGASVHGITQAHYEAPILSGAAPGPRQRPNYFNDGLLNDGNKVENIYFTANLGAGFDLSMTKYFSLFAEAMYHHRFEGEIGLTNDKFNTFATNVGICYTFK